MSHPSVPAAIALGSNLGDRRAHIEAALAALGRVPGVKLVARGPILDNPPLAKRGVEPGGPYLNSACVVHTTLDPHQLMGRLQHIEREHARQRETDKPWAPRTLDLDLLLFSQVSCDDPGLTLPHPRMHERRFVLEPLAAIAPDWDVPGKHATVGELFAALATPKPARKPPASRRRA